MKEEIERYINENYEVLQEHPWEKFPDFTTFKHTHNKKWFALIMEVPFEKLQIEKKGSVYVINLKNVPELIGSLRKQNGILPAYHMNKEHWITVLLDGCVPKEEIYSLIDISYGLTINNKNNSNRKELI